MPWAGGPRAFYNLLKAAAGREARSEEVRAGARTRPRTAGVYETGSCEEPGETLAPAQRCHDACSWSEYRELLGPVAE